MRFLDLNDIIFEISKSGYITDVGNGILSYNTFFSRYQMDTLLNVSASIILLNIDGKSALSQVFTRTLELYEDLKEDVYLCDFMDTINRLERMGIIYSTTEKMRYNKINEIIETAFDNSLSKLNTDYLHSL